MRLYELMESPESDKEQRVESTRVYQAVVDYLDGYGESWQSAMVKSDDSDAYLLKLDRIGLEYDTWVCIMDSKHAVNNEIGRMTMNGKYLILLVPDTDHGLMHLKTKRYRSVFIHEFTHLLDLLRHKAPLRGSSDAQSLSDYYNSPMEYNAYYQEAIHKFEEAMDGFKAHPTAWKSVMERISTFGEFFKFLRQYMSRTFVNYIIKDTAKRMLKRLYKYWEGMMEEYGKKR